MTATPSRDRSLVFFALLALWIVIELMTSSRWLVFRSILQQPIRNAPTPGSLASILNGSGPRSIPRVWFAPYTSFPEPGIVESRFRTGVYDTFLTFPSGGLASNYGAFRLGPADLLFSQVSTQGLQAEAQLAKDLGYQFFALDLGAIDPIDQVVTLCKTVNGCQFSKDGYALFSFHKPPGAWIKGLTTVRRLNKDFPQRAAGFRWAGVVLKPNEWFVPETSDLLIRRPGPPGVRIWAIPQLSNSLYLYRDQDLTAPVASRLQTRRRRLWLTLAPGVGGADLCLDVQANRPCLPLRLRHNQPKVEISQLIPAGQVTSITLQALFGGKGQSIRLNQLPILPGPSRDRAIYGIEIQ